MFSDNQKISGRQINRMLILDLFAVSCMILPKTLAKQCGRQGFFAIAAGCIFALLAAALLRYTGSRYHDGFYHYAARNIGRPGAVILILFYMIKFLFSAVFILKLFAEVINRTFLTEMPELAIGALMILTALYGVSKGIETRGRIGEILMWAVLIPIILIVILSTSQIKTDRIFPMQFESISQILGGSAVVGAVFCALEFLLFAMPYVRNKKHTYHFIAWAIIIVSIISALIYIACAGVFSVPGTAAEAWPTVILMQVIRLPGYFLARQDGLMLAFWMGSVFMLLGGYVFYVDEMAKQICPGKYFKGLMFVWLILVYGLFCLIGDYGAFEAAYFRMTIYFGIPLGIVIPGSLLIIDLAKNGRRKVAQ